MDLVVNGDNERRLWKRQVPRAQIKSTKSNEAVPEYDMTDLGSTDTNNESDSSSDPDTGPPKMPPTTPNTQIKKKPTKITPSTKATPTIIKNTQNNKLNKNQIYPSPTQSNIPNSRNNNPYKYERPTTKPPLKIRILPQDPDIVPNKKMNRRNRTTPKPIEVTEEPEEKEEEEEEENPEEPEEPEQPEEPEEEIEEEEEEEEEEQLEEPEEPEESEEPIVEENKSNVDENEPEDDNQDPKKNNNENKNDKPSTPKPKQPTSSGRLPSRKPPPPFPGRSATRKPVDRPQRPSPIQPSTTTISSLIRGSEDSDEPINESINSEIEPRPSSTPAPRQKQRPGIKGKPKSPSTRVQTTQSPPSNDNPNDPEDNFSSPNENNPNSSNNDPNPSNNYNPVITPRPKNRPGIKNPSKNPTRTRLNTKIRNKTTTTPQPSTESDEETETDINNNNNTQLSPRFGDDLADKNTPSLKNPVSFPQVDNQNYPNSQSSPGNPANAFSSASSFGNANAFAGASASASASSTGNANSFASASTRANPTFGNVQNSWPDNTNFMNSQNNYQNNGITPPSTSWMIPPLQNSINKNPSSSSISPNPIPSTPNRHIPNYTPIISISGTFDNNDKSNNYPKNLNNNCNTFNCNRNINTNPIYSQNYPNRPMTNNNYQPQQYPNQMTYNPNTYPNPNYGNTNYGNPGNNGDFASAGSFANGGVGGYQSSMNNQRYPGNNEINLNSRFGPGQGFDFGFPNDGADDLKWVQDQNRVIQAQIDYFRQLSNQQSQHKGSFATASASMNDGDGRRPNKNVNIYSRTRVASPPFPSWDIQPPVNHPGGFHSAFNIPQQFNPYQTRPMNNPPENNYFYPANSFDVVSPYSGPNDAWAWGNANAGPSGGSQSGEIGPVGPGIASRFAEDVPSPGGDGSYSSFSSSSSSSKVGPDGKVITTKEVTTGVNNNGKVSIRTLKN